MVSFIVGVYKVGLDSECFQLMFKIVRDFVFCLFVCFVCDPLVIEETRDSIVKGFSVTCGWFTWVRRGQNMLEIIS